LLQASPIKGEHHERRYQESIRAGQWDEVFNAVRSEASAADAGGGTLRSDFLEANRNNIRKKFDDIDGEFREKFGRIERN
jgi:hypothetical protein